MNYAKIIFVLSITVLTTTTAFARDWKAVRIPDAQCGDGLPYYVFVDKKKHSKNLLIEFMGGGACWSLDTCYGPNLRTWVHPIPEVPAFSYLTSDFGSWSEHPFKYDSAIYFPYCTGDVHSGNHVAKYGPLKTYHTGYSNVQKAFYYLTKKKIISFKNKEKLTVWGASAGAIGALVHLKTIEPYVDPATKKYAIIDSPGLHFGKNFWHKFSDRLQTDYQATFLGLGVGIDLNDGLIAPKLPGLLNGLKTWKLGFLQSTKDAVMSTVFGEISAEDHKALLESDQGLPAVVRPYENIKIWLQDSSKHTFLLTKSSAETVSVEGLSAIDFVHAVVDQE
ncbi:MAG: pectin acetylesterase-family hydrolase [Pseudobdellovibrio sp.]